MLNNCAMCCTLLSSKIFIITLQNKMTKILVSFGQPLYKRGIFLLGLLEKPSFEAS